MRPILLSAIVLLAGVECRAQTVKVESDETVDLARYATFAWKDTAEDLRDTDAELHERTVAAIKDELRRSGLREAASGADLYVTYHSAEKTETRLVWRDYGWGGESGSRQVRKTATWGTLIVDIWTADDGRLIWQGTAEGTVTDRPSYNENKLFKAIGMLGKRWSKTYRKARGGK